MTKKAEITQLWLTLCLRLYDSHDEIERRALFMRTCKAAAKRFTAKDLQWGIDNIQHFLEANQEVCNG